MVFKEAPSLVFSGLTKAIGAPRDVEKNLEDPSYFQREHNLAIPHADTDQLKPKEIPQPVRLSVASTVHAEDSVVENPDKGASEVKKRISEVLGDVHSVDTQFTPIRSLNTFTNDWRIKARITKKHPRKEWKNART